MKNYGDLGAWTSWMKAANNRPDTITQRVYHVRRMLRELRTDPWCVTTDQLVEWLASKDWKPNTLRSYRASLVAFYTWGQGMGRRQDNPAVLVPRVHMPRGVPRPTPEDVYRLALLEADERTRLMIHLAAVCGLRRGEISRLKHEDVTKDLLGWSLRVEGKGGHERMVPLPPELALDLRRQAKGWVFPSSARPGPLTPAHVGKLVSRALPEGWACHALRHRCGTIAYARSKDLRAVQVSVRAWPSSSSRSGTPWRPQPRDRVYIHPRVRVPNAQRREPSFIGASERSQRSRRL